MKNLKITAYLLMLSTFFSACSNMTIGFEEDSIFYTEPKAVSDSTKEEKNESPNQKTFNTAAETEKDEEEENLTHKTKALIQESLDFIPEERTQMYYERDDGE